jgi:hypothetical protein
MRLCIETHESQISYMRSYLKAWLALWLAMLAFPALGTEFVPLSIPELTAKSDLIVRGIVKSSASKEDSAGRIFTQIELDAAEIWKGTNQPGMLTVVHGGGTVGQRRVAVSGQVQYAVGEEVVAFLVFNERGQAVTIGLAQGKFHVWTDSQSGEKLAANPFHGLNTLEANATESPARKLTLSTLKTQVQGGRQ